jgi:hypothetical protein
MTIINKIQTHHKTNLAGEKILYDSGSTTVSTTVSTSTFHNSFTGI